MEPIALRDGRYVLIRPLGEGAQAETFEAVDKGEGCLVAVKRFRVGAAKAWKDVELAEREAKTLAALAHDMLPAYVEHFEEDGALYLVMERIEGESLAVLRKRGGLGASEVVRMLEDAARVLAYLHGRSPPVIHRDIKPSNVIRRKDGSFAFVDFGAVRDRLKPEGGSTVVGTFGYMAPEQFQGRASPASDVYGVGATALALLTGCEPEDLPHRGLGIDVVSAVPKTTPGALVRALQAMLEPDPERRAASVDEALAELRRVPLGERPREERRPGERAPERRLARARPSSPPPLVVRGAVHAALFVARVAVWLTVGVLAAVPLVVLSVLFGEPLRRAARGCWRAAARSDEAMRRAATWAAEDRTDGSEVDARRRVRVAADSVLRSVRAVTPEQAQAEAIAEAERRGLRDAEAWADRWATREAARFEQEERRRR